MIFLLIGFCLIGSDEVCLLISSCIFNLLNDFFLYKLMMVGLFLINNCFIFCLNFVILFDFLKFLFF